MSRAVAVVVTLLLTTSLAAGPALGSQPSTLVQTPDGFEETTFRVTVYENGSATWAIEHQTPLTNETEEQRFEDFARNFERNETALYVNFVEQAGLLTQYGANETGRQMDARNFRRSAAANPVQSTGTVRMAFLWTNFANVSDGRVVVGDVFEGGFYIAQSQSLVFERGPSLAFAQVRPTPDARSQPDSLARSESVSWVGERSFGDRRPYVELGQRSAVFDGDPTAQTDATTTVGPSSENGMWPLVVVAIVVALGAVAAAAWRSGAATAALGDDDSGGTAAESPADPDPSTEEREQPAPEPAVSDEELLSDSDRVINLLEENGGRMKQVDIVDTTDWSKSKVSMLLSDMEEDGDISKLRVGRENIISLSGQEPDAAGSPFDEE
ncbi:helix-turn-helix transcriptional regulator [Haloarcula pellucida]|uniref:IclR helix-turn-helix domain-containing protein n=1 Tax=Haloarcula pellucida TaxID=1427151 RepID=A0A830GHX0_9EURY|nr:hypothetical protein [Halomicroarcula pellucida]MBX0347541.1 hypothetical protein [Halomicroarcula pellucida]GGN89188.1 hypothetical protein GCM10009030_09660 [Halomicroarcula pellucida]